MRTNWQRINKAWPKRRHKDIGLRLTRLPEKAEHDRMNSILLKTPKIAKLKEKVTGHMSIFALCSPLDLARAKC